MTTNHGYRHRALGARIRSARTQAGLTQSRLGELVGVRAHTVWCWEAGRMRPRRANLLAIASHCATSVAGLEGRDDAEAQLLLEAEAEFRNAVRGLLPEDIASIRDYIRFVRSERRKRTRSRAATPAAPAPPDCG